MSLSPNNHSVDSPVATRDIALNQYLEPNYRAEAQDMVKRTGKTYIYADKYSNQSSPVLKVAAYIDLMRYPASPLGYQPNDYWGKATLDLIRLFTLPYNYPPTLYWNNGFMLGQLRTNRDTLVKAYSKGKRRVYLFCRGTACL